MNFTKSLLFTFSFLIFPFSLHLSAQAQNPDAKKVTVKLGQIYTVKLESFPGTFYEWTFNESYDTTYVQYKGHTFIPDPDTSKPGKPGMDNFTFKALQKGQVSLRFAYKRNWERVVARVEEYILTIE